MNSDKEKTYDLIVVGGGTSGAAAGSGYFCGEVRYKNITHREKLLSWRSNDFSACDADDE